MKIFKNLVAKLRDDPPPQRPVPPARIAEVGIQIDDRPAAPAPAAGARGASRPGAQGGPSGSSGHPPAPARRANAANVEHATQLLLKHLRIGNETDVDLVTIPVADGLGGLTPRAISDATTDGITGLDYLEHIATDTRILPCLRNLIKDKLLPVGRNMQAAARDTLVAKLRLIANEALRDPQLALQMEDLAMEYIGYCGDRAEYILSQLHGLALLANLRRGDIDNVSLYNIGVSFFKLNALHQEIARTKPEIFRAAQSVHELQEIEFALQSRLKLPFQHDRPIYPRNTQHINPGYIEELAAAVEKRCIENDGEAVIAFMSTWAPWVAVVNSDANNQRDIGMISDQFATILSEYEQAREREGSPENKHTERQVIDVMNRIMALRQSWTGQYAGQRAREFLVNHRACIVLDNRINSAYLNKAR